MNHDQMYIDITNNNACNNACNPKAGTTLRLLPSCASPVNHLTSLCI